MKKEKTIYLPDRAKEKIKVGKVIYDDKKLLTTVNNISLKLGASVETTNTPYTMTTRPCRKEFVRRPYTYNISHSYLASYNPLQRTMPGLYRFYSNEDKMIPYLLSLSLEEEIIDSFYIRDLEIKWESFNFWNEFCFEKLYEFLNQNNGWNDSKYLEVLREYLKVFKIIKTNERITEEYFKEKYYYATRTNVGVERSFYYQRQIAERNAKVLFLKKVKKEGEKHE